MKWAEISIQTSHEATEAVAEIFHELGASGVLIEDPELVNTYIHSGAWDYTDIPLAEETEVVTVKAWLPTDEDLPSKLEQLRLHIDEMSQFLDKGSGVINCSEIQDEDWANNWKQFFHPERIGEKIVVKPSWEEYTPLDNDIVIELDPGMAFGTGTHATTSMCIQLLEEYVKPEMKVFDVGTGSGIIADIIIRMFNDVDNYLNQHGAILTSGIIADRIADVTKAAEEHGFMVEKMNEKAGWAAIIFRRKEDMQ